MYLCEIQPTHLYSTLSQPAGIISDFGCNIQPRITQKRTFERTRFPRGIIISPALVSFVQGPSPSKWGQFVFFTQRTFSWSSERRVIVEHWELQRYTNISRCSQSGDNPLSGDWWSWGVIFTCVTIIISCINPTSYLSNPPPPPHIHWAVIRKNKILNLLDKHLAQDIL